MPRLALRSMLWLGLLLSCLAVSAYALAHRVGNYQEVRQFLEPFDDCAAPCWQGIRPGITDSLEAVDKLRALPWVTGLYAIQGIVINDSYIRWKWNGNQPAIVDGQRDGRMWFHNGTVYSIEIPLRLSFGIVWSAFGPPQLETTFRTPFTPPQVFYNAAYLDGTLQFSGIVLCPPRGRHLLNARADATIALAKDMTKTLRSTRQLECENAQR
ncbi:MAG: hypothetical protein GC179_23070 [Anaerolineaceae bacterium]|nr:hypothetical protein [Anaerolineaceae bacterium]